MSAKNFKALFACMSLVISLQPTISNAGSAPINPSSTTPSYSRTFELYVDKSGNIKVPRDYRTSFIFLGSFVVPSGDSPGGVKQLHQVYIDRDSIEYYKSHGEFPDGAMLIKELQSATAANLTTGHASFWDKNDGWFVMIKNTKERFQKNGIWTDGWGWALISQDAPTVTTNKDTSTCISCHTPVKKTDWLHVWGYPLLEAHDKISTLNTQ